MPTKSSYILALDIGEKRIGVALASTIARLARPLTVLENDGTIYGRIKELAARENAQAVIVGLPRSLQGEDTAQTRYVRSFAVRLGEETDLEIILQDEALTSRQAESELRSRGKKYAKGDIDALAATYILEDYLKGLGTIESMELQT